MEKRRYRRIILFFVRLFIYFTFWDLFLAKIGFKKFAVRTRSKRLRKSARDFRELAIQMGGVLIKVGQFLSSRVDILPVEVTEELEGLQDEVPPESSEDIIRLAERELGKPIANAFRFFDEIPLAAASLGQVHRAVIDYKPASQFQEETPDNLRDSREVVVKIQRPNIEILIATDLAALRTIGKWFMRYRPISNRADIMALIDEFTTILYEEIDYLNEGKNAEVFAANFAQDTNVRFPEVIWSHTTKRVLTLENVLAIKINDYAAIDQAGIDRKEVAGRLLNIYLKQIFEDGFFHADPHPGNLFVLPLAEPADDHGEGVNNTSAQWQLTFVDFGMVGKVSQHIMDGLRDMLVAVGTKDTKRMVKAFQDLGFLLPSADLELLERAEARVFERFWGKTMSELQQFSTQEMREIALEFRELIFSMPFQIPHNMIFLARAVGILSGICTGLDPDFNVWQHLAPYAQKLVSRQPMDNLKTIVNELIRWVQLLYGMPVKLDALIEKINLGKLSVQAPDISHQIVRLDRNIQNLMVGLIFAALLIGGVLLLISGWNFLGQVLLYLSAVCVVIIILRSQ